MIMAALYKSFNNKTYWNWSSRRNEKAAVVGQFQRQVEKHSN